MGRWQRKRERMLSRRLSEVRDFATLISGALPVAANRNRGERRNAMTLSLDGSLAVVDPSCRGV